MRADTALWCALFVVLGVALPISAVGATGGAGAAATAGEPNAGQPEVSHSSVDHQTVHLDIQLQATGDADWTVRTYVPLDGAEENESFRELGRRYTNGTADVDIDVALFQQYVAAARSASGREMRIADESVERSWTIENGTGVLELRFTWTNFARAEGDKYVIDDAFESPDGTWLPRLEAGQKLVIHPPEGVGFIEAPIRVSNASLQWEGPKQFGTNYFQISYRKDPGSTPGTGTTPATDTPSTGLPLQWVPGGGAVMFGIVAVGMILGYFLIRRRPINVEIPSPRGPESTGSSPSSRAESDSGSDSAHGTGGTDARAPDDGESQPTPEQPFAGVDVEMLSDEERVIRLLEANGGRMKQAQIVSETNWSNAKVSQLLSSMDDGDEIDKLRIGRENLISLPNVDVDRFPE